MTFNRPKNKISLEHVALNIFKLDECINFYVNVLGMKIIWQPDADNIYLSSGSDNLALHRAQEPINVKPQHLDHFGFVLQERDDVDRWHDYLIKNNVDVKQQPKDHRDGARSLYCADPDGNIIQLIWLGN